MINDIAFYPVENIKLVVTKTDIKYWQVHLINNNNNTLKNTLVTSKGYGESKGNKQKTSVLRHYFEKVPANGSVIIESITDELFHLFNEYWISYYIGNQIYDKKFLFVPESIKEEHLVYIEELDLTGVLHS